MSSAWVMVVYVGGISHLSRYFLHRHEGCGHVHAIDKGKEVHEEIIDKGLLEKHSVLYLAMPIVDMYAKCGALMNVCGILRYVGKSKKSMMKLLSIF